MDMSVSKWAYEPKKCDGGFCYGECDNCHKAKDRQADWSYITLMIRAAVAVTVDKLNELQEQRVIKKERSMFE